MFFSKIRRLFYHKKASSKPKKIIPNQSEDELILRCIPPKFADEDIPKIQTPPSSTRPRFTILTDASKNVVVNDENPFALTTTTRLPRFRNSAKWQSSKPFAQNALRFRFRSKGHRFISSRSKNSSSSNQQQQSRGTSKRELKHVNSLDLIPYDQQVSKSL